MTILWATLPAAIILASAATCFESKPELPRTATDQQEGARLTADGTSAQAGKSVPLRVRLANEGSDDVSFGVDRGSNWPIWRVELIDKDGKAVPRTRFGALPTVFGSSQLRIVKPGEGTDLSYGNLALLYDLTVAGDYEAIISLDVGLGGGESPKRVKLKLKVKITIEEP
jgi:hypothetical protein